MMTHLKHLFTCTAGLFCLLYAYCQPAQQTYQWMTFNLRYDNAGDGINNWNKRKEKVVHFIKAAQPDVVGMQEVLHNQLEYLKENLSEYEEAGVGRDDGQTRGEYSPIFYKKDRFNLISHQTIWLSEYPDSIGHIGWDAACPRIATWVKLQDKRNGKIMLAVNTHFDHQGEKAQINSAKQIISQLKEYGNLPVVLTGDFNITESQQAYTTLTGNGSPLKDTYKIARKKEGVSYTYHNFSRLPRRKRKKVDYIFVTSPVKVAKINIPHEDAIPRNQISDHCPYIAILEF